jgi:hypothetical protein
MDTNKQVLSRQSQPVVVAEVKRRRRLENLLYTRGRLAVLSAEHRSHGLDDAVELYQLQLETEHVIADEFPVEFEVHLPGWADFEAGAEHHPEVVVLTCSICTAISNNNGASSPRAA